jgi:enterochelin esterase-like enzyme
MRLIAFFWFSVFSLAFSAIALDCQAQEPAPRSGTVSDGGRGSDLASPIVDQLHRVTFRVKAPQANKVSVTCDFRDETALVKGDDGVWSVTVGPIDPDIYYYNFIVDGVRTVDPGNSATKVGYYTSTLTSVLTVPGSEPAFYDVKDVPHGEIRTILYRSKSNDVTRELNVYVPPNYDESPSKRYPVLYLLHGNANDHSSWLRYGRANEILDNLLAAQSIQPFLVVMPLGYGKASVNGDSHGVAAGSGPDNRGAVPPNANAGPAGGPDFYEQDILKDVVPLIDSKYRTIADSKHRAIFGFSMGGGQAGKIGLGNLDVFGSVGIMSAGLGRGGDSGVVSAISKDVAATNQKLDLLWIGCGKDDFAFPGASGLAQSLKNAGIKHTFVQSEGGHHWRVWRRYLHEIAPQLFQTDK